MTDGRRYRDWIDEHPRRLAALRSYQSSADVNGELREGRTPAGTKRMDRSFRRAPTVEGVVLWRGLSDDVYDALPGLKRAKKRGDVYEWTEPGYLSTSRSKAVGESFCDDGLLLRLRVPEPIPAVRLHWISGFYRYERELLLPRGCRIRIGRWKKTDGIHRGIGIVLPPM